jgi:biotin operon repressor
MYFLKQLERIQELDKLLKKRSTGTPETLAKRLGVSRSHLYNLISYLDDLGMQIKFSRRLNSFYYVNTQDKLEIAFSIKIVNHKGEHNIYGGRNLNLGFKNHYNHNLTCLENLKSI